MQSEFAKQRTPNPRENAHPISAALYLYMIPIFWRFNKKKIAKEDLFEALIEDKSKTLGKKLETIWNKTNPKYKKHALHIALLRQFKWELLMAQIVFAVSYGALAVLLPVAVNGLVLYFQNKSLNDNKTEAYYFAGLLFLALGVRNFFSHSGLMWMSHICLKMRIACCSLSYRKVLKASSTGLAHTTIGQIVNLLSNDVGKFEHLLFSTVSFLSAPIVAVIGSYQLYSLIGVSALYGMVVLMAFMPLQIFLGKLSSRIRLTTSVRTDERLRLMIEVLSGINVIKMYTWEMPFAKLVEVARRNEVKAIRARFYIESVRRASEHFTTRAATFIALVAFASLGNYISANTAFSVTATFTVLRAPLVSFLSLGIGAFAEVYISLIRIQNFLRFEELEFIQCCEDKIYKSNLDNNESNDKTETEKRNVFETPRIILKNVSAKWCKELPDYALENVHLNLSGNQLIALIGPVGSGKSTLLDVILKELPIATGTLSVFGKISFASQEPWLFGASVRQNILFGDHYDQKRYNSILDICALEADLKSFPYGDQTIISESGKSLSGGQRSRINLARCLYRQADVYLLDDPLSAVDSKVVKYLFEKCIKDFLREKICVLVTHQLQFLASVDKIVILEKGNMVAQGNYYELQNIGFNFTELLKGINLNEDNNRVSLNIAGSQADFGKNEETKVTKYEVNEVKENLLKYKVFKTYGQYFKAGGGYGLLLCLFLSFIAAHSVENAGDYFVVVWVRLEQTAIQFNGTTSNPYVNSSMTRRSIIYLYSGIIMLTMLLLLAQFAFFFVFFTRASVNLHNSIFQKIICASMRFFDTNPSGRILNRFSKDVGIVDEYIPMLMSDVFQISLILIASLILSAIIDYWILLPYAVLLIPFYFSRSFYLRTSKGSKRIEAATRSPIFNHITVSMNGLSTIRAFEAQNKLLEEFDAHMDLHGSASYLYITAIRALSFWLDTLFITFIIFVISYSLITNQDYSGSHFGFLITNYVFLSTLLSYGMRQINELENCMISVERVLEYTQVETEPTRDVNKSLPTGWPEYGKIAFNNTSLNYTSCELPALKHINLTVSPSEKIGVVGRTGAGKSSLIAALFQMYNTAGNISIDSIDIEKVPLIDLRSKISIVPQQPVLFFGSLRKNLDPLEKYNDDMLWHALEQVELKHLIESYPGGLSTKVQEGGSNFSIGQKQLICFARAIICKNKILIMDEATANIDPHTDAIIQKTIRRVFKDCTCISIAHRLHTVADSDKVLVMDNGSAVEFDHPYNLLQTPHSLFYKMAQASGKDAFEKLFAIAETGYKKHL